VQSGQQRQRRYWLIYNQGNVGYSIVHTCENMQQGLESDEIKAIKDKTKVVCRAKKFMLESCTFRPIMRNSVLEELRVRRLADIQGEICFRAVWRWSIVESKLRGWNEEKS